MSRRTFEANKAISMAWENEQQLISEGRGTRDWTPEQQQDILERGKAYDDNGKAFEGQHMRSAEMHPECQGDTSNIQFLTREEHLAAHDGDWRNPSNWYYDPVEKRKMDFGDGPVIPCVVLELSKPVYNVNGQEDSDTSVKTHEKSKVTEKAATDDGQNEGNANRPAFEATNATKPKAPIKLVHAGGFWAGLKKSARIVCSFIVEYKDILIIVGGTLLSAAAKVALDNSRSNSEGNDSYSSSYNYTPSSNDFDSEGGSESNYYSADDRICSDERQSPREHDVSGYTRHWNGKDINVEPYQRGGRKSGEQ